MAKLTFLVGLLFALAFTSESQRLMCVYKNYTTYRPGQCSAVPNHENLNPQYCTHLLYNYVGVSEDGTLYVSDPYSDLCDNFGMCGYERIAYLKVFYPALQTLFWIGNDGMQGTIYDVAADEDKRQILVNDALDMVNYFNYDGVVLNWNRPTEGEAWAFTLLVTDFEDAFSSAGLQFGVTGHAIETDAVYEEGALNIPDFVIVTAFFYRGYESGAWHPSPLYRCNGDFFSGASIQNVDHAMQQYPDVDSDKLIVPIYGDGLSFVLENPDGNIAIGAPVLGPTAEHECLDVAGQINYDLVCEDNGYEVYPLSGCNVDILVKDNEWVSVETPSSVLSKSQYARGSYGGIAFMSYDGDDFDGSCGDQLGLHKIAYETLFDNN